MQQTAKIRQCGLGTLTSNFRKRCHIRGYGLFIVETTPKGILFRPVYPISMGLFDEAQLYEIKQIGRKYDFLMDEEESA